MKSVREVYESLRETEYRLQLEYLNADKASRLATIYAVKNTVDVWREQFRKD